MANVTNARVTLGALFGTVTTVASTVTSVFDTAGKVVSMGENYVDAALRDQRDRMAADAVDSLQRIAEEKAMEMTERQVAINKYIATSPVHAESFKSNYNSMIEAIEKSRGVAVEA